jgi:hypothetical protein
LRNTAIRLTRSPLRGLEIAPLVLSICAIASIISFYPNDRPQFAMFGAVRSELTMLRYLKDETEIVPGSRFRGNVAQTYDLAADLKARINPVVMGPAKYDFGDNLSELLVQNIPVYNEYNQLAAPAPYYLASRLTDPQRYVFPNMPGAVMYVSQGRNQLPHLGTSPMNLRLSQAFGTRFVMHNATIASEFAELKMRYVTPRGTTVYLYELPHSNRDGFSPTRVHVIPLAKDYVALLGRDEFDFRNDVALAEAINVSLVPASKSEMYFPKDGVRVVAESVGTSLVVLPVQYSRCLKTNSGDQVQLLRANLVQVGLLFERKVDTTFNFQTGPLLNPRCRSDDLRDLKMFQLGNDGRFKRPPAEVITPFVGIPILPFLRSHIVHLLLDP